MEVKKDKPGSLSPVRSLLKRDSDDGRSTRSGSAKSEREVRLPPEKSPCDDKELRKDSRSLSRSSDGSKDTFERQDSSITISSPKVSRKYFTNWRQACDKTKDKTKDFLKRWRTLPEAESSVDEAMEPATNGEEPHTGWSVHVWSKKNRQKTTSKMGLNRDKTVRRTRKSNKKEKGFYNFKAMLNRNIMKQTQVKQTEGRMKNSRSSRIMSLQRVD